MTDYIFSKAAATRIFGKQAQAVAVERDRAIITFTDGTTATTSTAEFKQHFASHRQRQGENLSPMLSPEDDAIWYVSKYKVKVNPDHLTCTCRDWRNQQQIGITRSTCKHCYAVLSQLGCNSLAEYLEKSEEARDSETAANQTSETSLNLSSSVSPKLPKLPTYILRWETYGRDRAGNPLETASTKAKRLPTTSELRRIRWDYHRIGYKLVDVQEVTA